MDDVNGYKAFNEDRTNRYGMLFEEGKTYYASGKIKFGNDGNGFHMCTNLCDVFRYFDSEKEIQVAKVIGRGEKSKIDDEYNGYYDMYAVSEITIERFLTRKEIIDLMIDDQDFNIIKFLKTFNLNDEEKELFLLTHQNNLDVASHILCCQYNEKNIFYLDYKEREQTIKRLVKTKK